MKGLPMAMILTAVHPKRAPDVNIKTILENLLPLPGRYKGDLEESRARRESVRGERQEVEEENLRKVRQARRRLSSGEPLDLQKFMESFRVGEARRQGEDDSGPTE